MVDPPLHKLPRRKQKATWWRRTGVDQFGQPVFAAALEINCRWEESIEEFTTATGEKKISRATVYPDRRLAPGDYLWEGTLATAPANPLADKLAWEVKRFDVMPDTRAKRVLYTAYL